MSNLADTVEGCQLGLEFPTSIAGLEQAGPEFLTAAFRRAGAIDPDNRVVAITRFEPFEAGGMGPKLRLDVVYERDQPDLHCQLFAKFPRPVGDPLRLLFAPIFEPEVRLYLLSRTTKFPVPIPRLYYADYHRASASSILITERIAYGENGIVPCFDKAMDDRIADPLSYYEAVTQAIARLAGRHKAGGLGPAVDSSFPFDPEDLAASPGISFSAAALRQKTDILLDFAARAPQLFPDGLGDTKYLTEFAEDAQILLIAEKAIRLRLNRASNYIALCHWNLHLDNAWFWTGDDGVMQVGLLDWGATAQGNIAQSFSGMIGAAEIGFVNRHRDHLLHLFAQEYAASGGPVLDSIQLKEHYRAATAVQGIAWMLDAPSLIKQQLPGWQTLSGRHDPALQGDFLARAQHHILMVFLNEWRELGLGEFARQGAAASVD